MQKKSYTLGALPRRCVEDILLADFLIHRTALLEFARDSSRGPEAIPRQRFCRESSVRACAYLALHRPPRARSAFVRTRQAVPDNKYNDSKIPMAHGTATLASELSNF